MIYGSVCSGIEAASVAWHPLGWRASFLSEIEPFPRAVLSHHYPDVPLHGDFTTIQASDYEPIDLLVGGTPCQSFSVAGLRGGMADARGNLALEYLRLAERCRPKWLVWENVPGVLSSNDGRDFASFLGGLGILGYGWAYRVLDAQYFGLAQRRKRVFVVGHSGSWRSAAAVLFEPASLRGHPAPRREARERVAPTISSRPTGGGGLGTDFDLDGGLIARSLNAHAHAHANRCDGESETFVVSPPITSNPYGDHESREGLLVAHSLRAEGFDASEDGTGRGVPLPAVAIQGTVIGRGDKSGPAGCGWDDSGTAFTQTKTDQHAVAYGSAVRRLTPRECERLQGFPDDYSLVPYRGKIAADGPRYKALGNSFAVTVVRWIGKRIEMIEESGRGQD